MSWNRVAVVGAGLIKMGELFEQSYEQMAAGAFDAAVASVDKGFEPDFRNYGEYITRSGDVTSPQISNEDASNASDECNIMLSPTPPANAVSATNSATLRWVLAEPFGTPVDPDVKMTYAS